MNHNNLIFDLNTLILYNVCENQSLDDLQRNNHNILLSDLQKDQYNFWKSLSKYQREYISEQLNKNDRVVANIKLYPVPKLDFK
jgi:hypothetical protein